MIDNANNRIWKNLTWLMTAMEVIAIVISYCLLWNRIRYGIDFTDESWYVAEPYIVSQGAIPFVNNWTQAPGFSIPLAIFFKLYVLISGGTEGIVLFSRSLYLITLFIVLLVSVLNIYHCVGIVKPIVLSSLVPLLLINVYSLYDLTYNTMGVLYLFLTCTIIFMRREDTLAAKKKDTILFCLAGIIIARAIIASPSVLVGWGGMVVFLLLAKEWRKLWYLILGNCISAIIVIGCCSFLGGFKSLVNGLTTIVTKGAYFRIEARHTFIDDITYLFDFCKPVFFVFFSFLFVLLLFGKRKNNDCWFYLPIGIVCIVCYTLGLRGSLATGNYKIFIQYGWFQSIVIALFVRTLDRKQNVSASRIYVIDALAKISFIYWLVYLFSSYTNIYGFGSREYWLLIPTVIGLVAFCVIMSNVQSDLSFFSSIINFVVVFAMLILGGLLLKQNYDYVYRDASLPDLTSRVEYGIWKGCYTTPKRKENVELLEKYIHSITEEEDNVLFLDQVCFAYLMNDGKACSPTTSDPMCWTYDVDNDELIYEYFKAVGRVPNKVIYIDFGRDSTLSIHGEWRFNNYVKSNYIFVESYDTNPAEKNKHEYGEDYNSSFYVEYYKSKN